MLRLLAYGGGRTTEVLDLVGADRRVSPAVGFATSDVCMLMVVILCLFR